MSERFLESVHFIWLLTKNKVFPTSGEHKKKTTEEHWSCIAHLSAEDMLKSAVIAEKKYKHSLCAGADNPLGPKVLCQQEGLITMAVCCKFKKNLFSLWLYTHLFKI